MKARIHVTLKPSVLDPQGQTIQRAVETLGFQGIEDLRQGKYFELTLADTLSAEQAQVMVREIAASVLANPVIEEFNVELE
ncbi:MAG: phosphoribosylformylglycinamidine synthase subunit PurS [Acidobacteria bacterium]|nr:phosphoribosylformylglycinamidine synthase subunit PurS [Acidobacteriota bacterium]